MYCGSLKGWRKGRCVERCVSRRHFRQSQLIREVNVGPLLTQHSNYRRVSKLAALLDDLDTICPFPYRISSSRTQKYSSINFAGALKRARILFLLAGPREDRSIINLVAQATTQPPSAPHFHSVRLPAPVKMRTRSSARNKTGTPRSGDDVVMAAPSPAPKEPTPKRRKKSKWDVSTVLTHNKSPLADCEIRVCLSFLRGIAVGV